jgi:uncharacterized repeat protein (TIGR03803 family)
MKSTRLGLLLIAVVACSRVTAPGTVPPLQDVASSASSTGYQTLFDFDGTDGSKPVAGLIILNGLLYGTTSSGGADGFGTVFSLSASGTQSVLHSFAGSPKDGRSPNALTAVHGRLYGTTFRGGKCGCGTLFVVNTAGKERTLYDFTTTDGSWFPNSALVMLKNAFYGTSNNSVFTATTSGHAQTIHGFTGLYWPRAPLLAVSGVMYGTTAIGGASKYGTIYSITTAGNETVVYSFGDVPDGRYPLAGLVDVDGTLYGTTESGGSGSCHGKRSPFGRSWVGCGTVFEISTSGGEKVLYSFTGKADGAHPEAGLLAVNGALYGTTSAGGGHDAGTVFRISPSGSESVLHSFGQGSDGADPLAGLIDVNGTLYGTTASGGTDGDGTVFAMTP